MLLTLLGALAIGLSLGLLGSGGSILTVPVLHYLVGQPEKLAIGGSLLVVGLIAVGRRGAVRAQPAGRLAQRRLVRPPRHGRRLARGARSRAGCRVRCSSRCSRCVMLVAAWRMLRGGVMQRDPITSRDAWPSWPAASGWAP